MRENRGEPEIRIKIKLSSAKILEEVLSLVITEKNAEALVKSLDQRLTTEKKVYESSREVLEKISMVCGLAIPGSKRPR